MSRLLLCTTDSSIWYKKLNIQQLLNADLLDELYIDIAAVLLGSGVRLFDHLANTPALLGNPTVIPGVGVTHLRYPVRKA